MYKRNTYLAAALCVLLASCSKIDVDNSSLERSLIGFNTASTKAASAYPTDSPFITTSYKLASGKTWDTNKSDASLFINQEEVTYNSIYSFWKTSADYYWPTDGSTLTFFSYSPKSLSSKASVSTEGVSISSWNVKTDSGDILVADIAADKIKNESLAGYTGVPTYFRHKLSRIVFRFSIADEADTQTQVKLTSIVIKDVYSAAAYSRGGYSDDNWTPVSTAFHSSWTLYSGGLDLPSKGNGFTSDLEYNMIPQRLGASASPAAHPILEFGYSISTDSGANWKDKTASCYFDENLRHEEWEKGKKYIYKIYIGVGQYPIEFDGSVTDWALDDKGDITIG